MNLLYKFMMMAVFSSSILSGCCIIPPGNEHLSEKEALQSTVRAKAIVLITPITTSDSDAALNPIVTAEPVDPTVNEQIVKQRTSYTISDGDLLWSIAKRPDIYGDPLLWPLIYQANRDQIKDPRKIYTGQILSIPRNISESEREGARNQAKATNFFPQRELQPNTR